jgi:UPF0271 protein
VTRIDLNADVGEGVSSDRALLAVITSASVACGFHAGDEATMRATCALAATHGVSLGAHVSYRDREGFGRRALDVPPAVIEDETLEQITTLRLAAAAEGAQVAYVKPHGALYTRAARDRACAEAIAAAATRAGGITAILGPPGSELLAAATSAGLAGVAEGFADRGYLADGSLVPRGRPGALLGADEAVQQAVRLARDGTVRSLCLHGDSPGAAELAGRIAAELRAAGVELASFA